EVIPLYREYERFSTTCLNAYVGPKTARYLENFDGALRGLGMDAGLHLMQSSGGCATLDAAKRRAVTLLMSGPVGGLLGGIWVGTEPTATDCQLVLGRLDPAGFLGGRLKLDASLAFRAVETKLAAALDMDVEAAALAATRILTHGMVQAIEVNSVRKGYDPREF